MNAQRMMRGKLASETKRAAAELAKEEAGLARVELKIPPLAARRLKAAAAERGVSLAKLVLELAKQGGITVD